MSTLADRLVERALDKQAGHDVIALSIGHTFETELWRVHRFAESVEITHIAEAGRRGKKCFRWIVTPGTGKLNGMESQVMEFEMLAKRGVDFSRMKAAVEEAQQIGYKVHETFLKAVDVKPGNFKELIVRGIHVTIKADYAQFSIEDINDDANEPTCIAQGKKSVGQFYRWVKDNMQKAQTMTIQDIMNALDSAQISYHYYCAMD